MIRALAITGPTASGKTALSLLVAEELGCEIICLDSMQIYKEMSIGTAKATAAERARVPHHMLDFADPTVNYSAEDYRIDALASANEIVSRGGLPLFVGGTGLYLDTVMRGGELMSPPSSEELKQRLLSGTDTDEAREALWQRLRSVDPDSAEKIHKNNVRRVARALEIYELTGKTKTYFDELSRTASPDISVGVITLDFHDRENLYSRVDRRVDMMMAEGLLDEVRSLYERGLLDGASTASQAIGYKELELYLSGEMSLDEAVDTIKRESRRYAKRQLTWFRHVDCLSRVYVDREDGSMRDASELVLEIIVAARAYLAASEYKT